MDIKDKAKNKRMANLANLKPWKPGQSGNPGGRPRKLVLTQLYEKMLSDPVFEKKLEASLKRMLLRGGMAAVLHLREMADRVEGKIPQPVELSGELNLAERIQEARQRAGLVQIRAAGSGE